ncbi:MAG: YigZ family protein [Chloroflexi bacterium]|nr:YigZ family protein [Chloroflexota bacterium]MBU1748658.1 YigZ family protein [Chloroflexota bacterium]
MPITDALVPARQTCVETLVLNSRFIATVAPAFDVEQARAFIAGIRHELPDATHHVSAYLIGHGVSVIAHCHDDGEPAGTAGRPALAVLQGSGLGDVVVVVTRYFGGTKLGTGGLVRAYGDAVRQVLAAVPRAIKIPTHTARVVAPYALLEPVRQAAAAHGGVVLDEAFAGEVALTVRFAVVRFAAFQEALRELSRGALHAEVLATDEATIMPV